MGFFYRFYYRGVKAQGGTRKVSWKIEVATPNILSYPWIVGYSKNKREMKIFPAGSVRPKGL